MGGIDKRGIIVNGSQAEKESKVREVLDNAPEKFILGASCTLPGVLLSFIFRSIKV